MTISPEQIAEWRQLKGQGMTSAVGEYTPSEFWELLNEYERVVNDYNHLVTSLKKLKELL